MKNYRSFKTISKTFSYLVFILISLVVFYPLVYVVAAAFAPGNGIASMNIVPFKDGFTLKHFKYLFFETQYWLWFKNTFIIALWTTLLTVVISSLSAYVFSRFKFVFKHTLLMSMLILQIFPSFVGMIAIYVIFEPYRRT